MGSPQYIVIYCIDDNLCPLVKKEFDSELEAKTFIEKLHYPSFYIGGRLNIEDHT